MDKPILLSTPHISEQELAFVQEAFTTNWIAPVGPHVDAFEQEFCQVVGSSHAAAVSSGTAALHLALRLLGISGGDEVFCSTLTFIASANPIVYQGGIPVFIDSDRTSWNMNPDLLREAPGVFGKIGIYSFNGNKIITTSGGGMLVSEDKKLVDQARFLATQARDSAPHYQHSEIGYNYRLSNVLAGIGRGQLRVLKDRVAARRHNFEVYQQALGKLPGIEFMPEASFGMASRWLTCLTIAPEAFGVDREKLRHALAQEQIEARPVWKPLHLQPVFADCECIGGAIAEDLFERGLCLPSGSNLTDEDRERVIQAITQVHLQNR